MISKFENKYRFLSNFYPVDVAYCGVVYPTVEHAYQAAKTLDPEGRASILSAATPAEAKRMGRKVPMRRDWEKIKVDVMRELLYMKFTQVKMKRMLLATGDRHLEEGNDWGDTFWGVCRGRGQNKLGELLMEIRFELREGAPIESVHSVT